MKFWNSPSSIKNFLADLNFLFMKKVPYPIVIVSSGRSGSTMLCRAIINSRLTNLGKKILPRIVFHQAFIVDNFSLKNGKVYKSHLLAHRFDVGAKKIFIFDDPIKTYSSFYKSLERFGVDWANQHLLHLESELSWSDCDVDFLNYENQLMSWAKSRNTLAIKFDKLWMYRDVISEFLNIDLSLPPITERKSLPDPEVISSGLGDRLDKLYRSMPDYVLND